MNVTVILMEPQNSGNIGAVARALKVTGFSDLRLVNPCHYLRDEAFMMAHGSRDVLQGAVVYRSLEAATADCDFLVGTSAKKRSISHNYYPITQLAAILRKKQNALQRAAVIFGKEESGLSNEALRMCDLISYIPMKTTYPSFNLAQAVMLFSWELSELSREAVSRQEITSHKAYQILKQNIRKVLTWTGINNNENLSHRIMERLAVIEEQDINLLNSVVNSLIKKMEHNHKQSS